MKSQWYSKPFHPHSMIKLPELLVKIIFSNNTLEFPTYVLQNKGSKKKKIKLNLFYVIISLDK